MRRRNLPVFDIEGTEYLVDVMNSQFVQKANTRKRISFDDLEYRGTYYTLYGYAKERLKIPQLIELDPEGMAKMHNLSIDELKDKTDFDLRAETTKFHHRVTSGNLPVIDIAGHNYLIDLNLAELRSTSDPFIKIDLSENCDPETGRYQFYYQPGTKEVVQIDPYITRLPAGVVKVVLPDDRRLDIVYIVRNEGHNLKDYFMKHSFPKDPVAFVIPLSETELAETVKFNKETVRRYMSHEPIVKVINPNNSDSRREMQSELPGIKNTNNVFQVELLCNRPGGMWPTIDIMGTTFIVDVEKGEFKEYDNEHNCFSFYNLNYKGTHYEMAYNETLKNPLFGGKWLIQIPQLVQIDPEGMAKKYGLSEKDLMYKNDFDLRVDQEVYRDRVFLGKMPVIDIAGDRFFVDMRFDELRYTKDYSKLIILRDHERIEMDGRYFFYYDKTEKQALTIDPDITTLPENVVKVILPEDHVLDPLVHSQITNAFRPHVGVNEVKDYLMKFPFQKELKAKVIHLKDTDIAEQVNFNQETARRFLKEESLLKKNRESAGKDKGKNL